MYDRSRIIIDPKKSSEFRALIKENTKDKKFWEENARIAHTTFDKKTIDELFKDG